MLFSEWGKKVAEKGAARIRKAPTSKPKPKTNTKYTIEYPANLAKRSVAPLLPAAGILKTPCGQDCGQSKTEVSHGKFVTGRSTNARFAKQMAGNGVLQKLWLTMVNAAPAGGIRKRSIPWRRRGHAQAHAAAEKGDGAARGTVTELEPLQRPNSKKWIRVQALILVRITGVNEVEDMEGGVRGALARKTRTFSFALLRVE